MLLEVSAAEFRRTGFAQSEIATIAEQAGVSRGTFYFHFPTKVAVLAELRLREEHRIVGEVEPLLTQGEPLDVILREIVSGIVRAERRLGADLIREICGYQFQPHVVAADTPDDHPLSMLVFAALDAASSAGTDERLASADLAIIFMTGVIGLLATHNGPSKDRVRLMDSLINLTMQGVTAS